MNERKKVLELFEEQKEFLEEKISSGIEQYRKGDANIFVKDSKGNPVPRAKIKLNQKSHEFKFGANIFMLDELETDEKNEAYKKYFAEAFNMATLPFYWRDLEPIEGERRFSKDSKKIYRRPAIDLCMEFCKEHNIEPREHCLNYDWWIPDWLKEESVSYIKEKVEERMKILAERYSADIPCWEVTNETLFNRLRENKNSKFFREPDFVEWSFKTAEKYFAKNELAINDSHLNIWGNVFNYDRSAYYMQIERELRNGARIDAIGMQFHMFYKKEEEKEQTTFFYEPKHLYAVMDTYARFNKPLQITEVTIPAYSYDAEDEAIQAEIIEKLYSIWFSHPNMEQIIYWNLVDGYAAFGPKGDMTVGENYYYGGLLRYDLTPKPAYYTIKNLIKNKWHTEIETVTDNSGITRFKGFYGQYDVEIEIDGKIINKTINLTAKGKKEFNIEV